MTKSSTPKRFSSLYQKFDQFSSGKKARYSLWFLASLLGALIANLRQPTWFMTPKAYIDPWLYWAFGEIPGYLAKYFSGTYYFRRWTLGFPNYIFQNVFEPYQAQLIHRNLILVSILILSAALVFKLSKSYVASVAVIGILAQSDYFLAAIGQSYHGGTALILTLLLMHVAYEIRTKSKSPKLLAFLAGVLWALLFITYQFCAVLFLPILVFTSSRNLWASKASVLNFFLPAAVGFVSLDILDFLIGRLFGGWPELVSYSIATGVNINNSGSFTIPVDSYLKSVAFSQTSFSVFAILISFVTSAIASGTVRNFGIGLGTLGITFMFLPFVGSGAPLYLHTVIFEAFYCLLILPILISVLLGKSMTRNKTAAEVAIFTLVVAAAGRIEIDYQVWVLLIFSTAALTIAGSRVFRLRENGFAHISSITLATLLVVTTSLGLFSTERLASKAVGIGEPSFKSAEQSQADISAISNEVRALGSFALKENFKLYLVDLRPHTGWSNTISAFYGLYSALAVGYPPSKVDCKLVAAIATDPNSRLIALGSAKTQSASEFIGAYIQPCGFSANAIPTSLETQNIHAFKVSD